MAAAARASFTPAHAAAAFGVEPRGGATQLEKSQTAGKLPT